MFGKLLCKLGKHKQTGPLPIGEPGDVRYVCYRCKQVTLIRDNAVYTFYDETDPAVVFMEKMLEIGK